MPEELNPTDLLGVRPGQQEEVSQTENSEESESEESEDQESESGEGNDLDASEEDQDDEGEEEEESEDEGEDDKTDWKEKYEDAEKKRRETQSRYSKAESDIDVLLQQIQSPPVTEDIESESYLDGIDDEELVNVGTLKKQEEARNKSLKAKQAKQNQDDILQRISTIVTSKKDYEEIDTYFKENNLARDPETNFMTNLGRYYKAKFLNQELKIKQIEKEAYLKGKTDTKRALKKQRQKSNTIPPVSPSSGKKDNFVSSEGLFGMIQKRRRERGYG